MPVTEEKKPETQEPPKFDSYADWETHMKSNPESKVRAVNMQHPDNFIDGVPAGKPGTDHEGKTSEEDTKESPKEGATKPEEDPEKGKDETKPEKGHLDDWTKKRVDREKKRALRAEQETAALRKQVAELQGKAKAAPEKPSTSDTEDEAFPDRQNYQTDDAHLEDVKLWENGESLKHRPTKKEAKPEQTAAILTEEQAIQEQIDKMSPEERQAFYRRGEILDDLITEVAGLEVAGLAEEGLAEEFRDLMTPQMVNGRKEPSQIRMSDAMIEWLDDNPSKAMEVVKAFIKTPSQSRRIARKTDAEGQTKAMEALVKPEPETKTEKQPADERLPAPDMKPIGGLNTPPKKGIQDATNYKEFEVFALEERAKSGKGGFFGPG